MASLEKRSVSNLIEVMADERWERLAEQQGVAYAKTVADAMNLKVDMDNPAGREKLRRGSHDAQRREVSDRIVRQLFDETRIDGVGGESHQQQCRSVCDREYVREGASSAHHRRAKATIVGHWQETV